MKNKNNDLQIRIFSIIIMLAILIPLIIIGNIPFALGIGLVSILGYLEIMKLNKYPLLVKLTSFLALIYITYSNFDASTIMLGLDYKVLSISLLLIFIPIIFYQPKGLYFVSDAFKLYAFIFLLGLGLNYFILIRNISITYLILVLGIPMITDTFAYFGGLYIGKHKITKISPNKTLEGCIVGSIVGTIIMTIYYVNFIGYQHNLLLLSTIILIMSIIGQIGDLFFSAIKREYSIKDFSNLIPGHGGMLDRLDSLIFVAITFMIFAKYL